MVNLPSYIADLLLINILRNLFLEFTDGILQTVAAIGVVIEGHHFMDVTGPPILDQMPPCLLIIMRFFRSKTIAGYTIVPNSFDDTAQVAQAEIS